MARLLRVHQWVKNLLVFVPAVAAHRRDAAALGAAAAGFVAFSLCASSAYVLNDLLDVEDDRRHPTKAHRPLASGSVTPGSAIAIGIASLAAGVAVALLFLPGGFLAIVGAYWASTVAYSLGLKRVPMLDVIVLAGLYVVRILGGTLATGVPTSSWLFTFAMFLFLSLALVKRTAELHRLRLRAGESAAVSGRGYRSSDLDALANLGGASGFVAVLVLALYISGSDVTRLYAHPERLWMLCPLALYWTGRLWLLARRGAVDEDPVVFAVKDTTSWLVGGLAAAVIAIAA